MIVADLHAHTTASDGIMSFPEAVEAARAADLAVLAITDHDCLHPAFDDPITHLDGDNNPVAEPVGPEEGGLTVIRGIELRVDTGEEHIDLLGYAGRETSDLDAELDRLGADRIERGREVVERVETELEIELDVTIDENLGRPHIARAIERSEAPYDYDGAFEELIGENGPCYVSRELPSVEDGAALLADACEIVSLAHPFRYADTEGALGLCKAVSIDAVERFYPYGRSVETELIDRTLEEYDLLATGGSDAHDDVLGRAGLSAEQYGPIERQLAKP